MWIDRARYEFSRFGVGAFVTFTYDDEHLPLVDGFEHPTLDYSHYHKYLDTLRHRAKTIFPAKPNKYSHSTFDFTFIGSCEYGSQTERPHYHILFCGLDFYECEQFLKKSWKFGMVDVKPVKQGAFAYIVKYLNKQVYGKLLDELYYDKGCLPPKIFFSQGFGRGLYLDNSSEFQKNGFIMFGKRRVNVPHYYMRKMYFWNPQWLMDIDCKLKKEEMKRFYNYRRLGGDKPFALWKIQNKIVREYRLRAKKFKNNDSETILETMFDCYSNNKNIQKMLTQDDLYDMIQYAKDNGELPPF
ncbi:MAG: hypothetical protein O2U62_06785 [Candidatus Bathyarchaeota archaeon]|nr:hypothetical protein [Candidatus Bathyarchaeota archaeon]